MKFLFSLTLLTTLALNLGACQPLAKSAAEPSQENCKQIQLEALDSTSRALKDFHAKVLIVHFFATWCMSCKPELTALEEVYEYLNSPKFEVLAISPYDTPGSLESYAKDNALSFSFLQDKGQHLKDCLNISTIPSSIILDKNGAPLAIQNPITGQLQSRFDGPFGWNSRPVVEQLSELVDR